MNYMKNCSRTIKLVALVFSLSLLAASPIAAWYTGEQGKTLAYWWTILSSPSPLVTDYYMLGNLASAFLNAGMCGLACALFMILFDADLAPSAWAGYFLVIAHCFYGLNFVNMWPPMFGIWLYCKKNGVSFRDNLDMGMFSTAFGPFVSELLFRYPIGWSYHFQVFGKPVNPVGLVMVVLLAVFLGFAIPAMLPGAQLLHRGFNLYNGGLAFGLLGLLIHGFLYKTMGVIQAKPVHPLNVTYDHFGNSYGMFCNIYFLFMFLLSLGLGLWMDGFDLTSYKMLLRDTGHRTDFIQKYGAPAVLINLGLYGLMILAYFNVTIAFTKGAGFTGPTCGVILAAMTFAASGQHPKNVWPILAGYVVFAAAVNHGAAFFGREIPWSLSTQGYLNGVAFATGLCPFTGCYNRRIGLLAGIICAVMCTSTSVIHGGFVLYNGGLTAGITALILTPMLDHYYTGKVRS